MNRPPLALPPLSPVGRSLAAGLALLGLAASCLAQPAGSPPASALPAEVRATASALPAEVRATAAKLRDQALEGTRAYDIVRSLTVEVGPRSAGSRGDREAISWALRTLKGLGLENVHAEPVTVPHWDRGTASGEILSPYRQPVFLTALGGSIGTPEEGVEAEVVRVPSLAALAALPADAVRAKIVFFDTKMERSRTGEGYGKAVGVRGLGASAAAKLGAVAVLIRSIGTGNVRTPHTGAMRYDEEQPRIPAAALAIPDADLLGAELESGKPVTFRLKLTSRTLPDAQSANVVGEIPGREKPEEIVLLGAHLDSWDLGRGAIDDGAGCAIMAEAARLIGTLPKRPRRTVRVVLFANEEFGLSGARAYAAEHAADLPRHVLAGESDFGSGRVWEIDSAVAPERLPVVGELASLLAPLGIAAGGNTAGGGADTSPLAPAHVPIIDLRQDGTYYFDIHHTADDTIDKIDPKDMDQNVAAWAALAYAVADMPGDLGRAPEGTGRE